ncbi:hypothetical protein RN001_006147 [Aquatica leii]|uniref:ATP synthase F(0) complex subunit e, mitochondrial n=1 Tax=Aquatica leii TaxID=1421715 RepID=A0AAN7QKT2_9COLE|nr:hypothetical protein RN001_006147 [Aquatica leii]
MSTLAAPVRVSPLIKFARWSLLGSGILYGMFHNSRLSRKEAAIREVEDKHKAIRDKKLVEEKRLASERELNDLAKAAGISS